MQNRCLKTVAKITSKMSQHGPKWGPKGGQNRSKTAPKINQKISSKNGGFQEARGIPTDVRGAGPNSRGCISGPPNYLDLHDTKPLYPRLQNCKTPRLQDSKTPSLQALNPLLTGVLGTGLLGYWILGNWVLGTATANCQLPTAAHARRRAEARWRISFFKKPRWRPN